MKLSTVTDTQTHKSFSFLHFISRKGHALNKASNLCTEPPCVNHDMSDDS